MLIIVLFFGWGRGLSFCFLCLSLKQFPALLQLGKSPFNISKHIKYSINFILEKSLPEPSDLLQFGLFGHWLCYGHKGMAHLHCSGVHYAALWAWASCFLDPTSSPSQFTLALAEPALQYLLEKVCGRGVVRLPV